MGHLLAFIEVLRRLGVPADRYLLAHGLPVAANETVGFVPVARVWAFLNDVAQDQDPLFGWLCGIAMGDRPLEPSLRELVESAASLYEALLRFTGLVRAEATHLQVSLHGRGPDVLLRVCYPDMREIPGYSVSQAYQLGVILGIIRHFLGPDWMPEEIGLECSTAAAGIEGFLPGATVATGQDSGYIAIPRNLLYRPRRRQAGREQGERAAKNRIGYDLPDTLSALLRAYLPDGYPSARFAASLLGMSERTLERRLAEYGTTFGHLVDTIRFEIATQLLEQDNLPIADVAKTVGFCDQRNFARMFRRISGVSPREYRKAVSTTH
jgi:AraC-like DNA-binding protein